MSEPHFPTCVCGKRAPVQMSRRGGEKHGIEFGPHGPGTISWAEHGGHCEGCDAFGYEVDSTPFPCSTYELARDFVAGDTE